MELKTKGNPLGVGGGKKELPEGACRPVGEACSISLGAWGGGLGMHLLPALPGPPTVV